MNRYGFKCYNYKMNQNNPHANLNPPQKKAVESVTGPVLILAGPGSGKTRVITQRICYLVKTVGIRPYHILAVTFTNKAAREMIDRLTDLISGSVKELTIGTFHAICVRILRKEADSLGINANFTIYDGDDQLKLVKEAIKLNGLDPKNYPPGPVLSVISSAKSEMLGPLEYSQRALSHYEEIVSRVYERYQQLLNQNNALDFDDLLSKTVKYLKSNEEVLNRYQNRYQHILVDEFQDTNMVQYELVKLLSARHRNICVVGDPDQSIYSWRSADIRNILNFEKDYPDAETIYLEQNYRSTQHILQAADHVIAGNRARKPKRLWTENESGPKLSLFEAYDQQEEARMVIKEISALTDKKAVKPGDIAILYRTNAQSRALEEAFIRYGIAYKLAAGTKYYERREVKDILAYFKVAHNIDDSISLLRIINIPPRGIGKQTLEELNRFACSQGVSEGQALIWLAARTEQQLSSDFTPRSAKLLAAFGLFLQHLIACSREMKLIEFYEHIVGGIQYKQHLLNQPDGEDRWQNVEELKSVAQPYRDLAPQEGLAAFLESISLVSDIDGLNDSNDAVNLITLHQAKGLEFPVVFIVGLEENLLPHYRSMDDPAQMEEERRLCYVGITRAKNRVYLCRAHKRMLMGTTQANSPSRFLQDIPDGLLESKALPQSDRLSYSHFHAGKPAGSYISSPNPAKPVPPAGLPGDLTRGALPELKTGSKVRHPQFGEGIVVSLKPSGNDYEVVVAFDDDNVKIKKLLLSFARLEKI